MAVPMKLVPLGVVAVIMMGLMGALQSNQAETMKFLKETKFPQYESIAVYMTDNQYTWCYWGYIIYPDWKNNRFQYVNITSPDQIGKAQLNVYIPERVAIDIWKITSIEDSKKLNRAQITEWALRNFFKVRIRPMHERAKLVAWGLRAGIKSELNPDT